MKILVTGAAGFIGFNISEYLLKLGYDVLGIDNLNSYYDIKLKDDRLKLLKVYEKFEFKMVDINNRNMLENIFMLYRPTHVINLAAQAGIRYSIDNPYSYIESNIVGFINILEACRSYPVKHLLYASSSSVYGGNVKTPFSTNDNVDHPISLYAATKKSNELMAHAYSHLFSIPTTGLRFFTVYGPWGRPDMAYFKFTKDIIEGNPINIYNNGNMRRDFTFIDDICEGVFRLLEKAPTFNKNWFNDPKNISESFAPYKIYNIGNNNPISLMEFITEIESAIGKKALKNFMEMQPGDVLETWADISDLENDIDFKPKTSISEGIQKFVRWYRDYYRI